MLPTPGTTLDVLVILDVVDVEIPALIDVYILDRSNLLVDNVAYHLWSRIITNKNPIRFEDIWKIKLVRSSENLYISLSTPIQIFYIMAQLRKTRF